MNILGTARLLLAELRKELQWHAFHSELPAVDEFLGDVQQTFRSEDIYTGTYFDRQNTRWVWLEIGSTLLQIKFLLAHARAYKSLEPPRKNDLAKNNYLYNLHYNKMDKFNLAVFYLAKIEDLVFRLLFENLGALLIADVDITKAGWEKQVNWGKIKAALKDKTSNPALSQLSDSEYTTIRRIVAQFRHPSRIRQFLNYRHRITHRLRPSVDYPELYTYLEDRIGKPILDAEGREKGRSWGIGGRPTKPEFKFNELYGLAVNALQHYIALLRELKAIPRFSPAAVR